MKKKGIKKYISLALVCAVVAVLVLFTGCSILDTGEAIAIVEAQINAEGQLVVTYSDATTKILGTVVGKDGANGADGKDGVDGSLVISDSSSTIPSAVSNGIRSAVSITCKFEKTVTVPSFFPGMGTTTTSEYTSSGSGVIYELDRETGSAFIITNYHVVYDASSNAESGISDDIRVFLYGAEYDSMAIPATYVGGSLYYDIAVLRVDNSEKLKDSFVRAVNIADSDKVAVGDYAIAIGNAEGYGISATCGIVGVDSENIKMTAADGATQVIYRVMRVDTAVNSGNSGGGLFDDSGELIGIVNAKIVEDGVDGIGYAIPTNVAISVAENIIDYCYNTDTGMAQYAVIGMKVAAVDSKAVYDIENGKIYIEEAVSVYELTEGSAAASVFQVGDVFVSATIGNKTTVITRQHHVVDLMLDVRVGDTVQFVVLRGGVETGVSITVTADFLKNY